LLGGQLQLLVVRELDEDVFLRAAASLLNSSGGPSSSQRRLVSRPPSIMLE
jgi:hypothetical protein